MTSSQHRRRQLGPVALLGVTLALSACDDGGDTLKAEPGEELSGGETTVFDTSLDAFSRPAQNLSHENDSAFFTGNAFFKRNWVMALSSTEGTDGLGPTFNARSCSSCHFKGWARCAARGDEPFSALLLRLSVPGENEHGGPKPEPSYGGQFNHLSIMGVESEGTAVIDTEPVEGEFDDGTPYMLQAPRYRFERLSFGPMAEDTLVSPRVAPFVIGLGLLEALPEVTIEALADPDDRDRDGISGRVNRVWDPMSESTRLGRFGWKANQAGLEQQNSGALLGDIGITSPLFPDQDCPAPQTACASAANGGSPEIDQRKVDFITGYTRLLGVPARRDVNDQVVLRGKGLFEQLGCASCHIPKLETGDLDGVPEVSRQVIRPFTDLLLHDMGEALADGRPDFLANGQEWRTPPLWGIGLVESVDGHTRFMHDGRARDLTEAVLWHGGEASAAQAAFKALKKNERDALVTFLKSL